MCSQRAGPTLRLPVTRWVTNIAAAALLAASLVFLWLTFSPSGLDQTFGEDEFGPLSGFALVGLTIVASVGILRWSRLRWLGIAFALVGILFWVPYVLNTAPAGPSPLLAGLYIISAVFLLISVVLHVMGR